jgi:hypothetical protein
MDRHGFNVGTGPDRSRNGVRECTSDVEKLSDFYFLL